jgi:hypothetical protein
MDTENKSDKYYLYLNSLSEVEKREFLKKASSDKDFLKDFIRSLEIDTNIEEYLNKESRSKGI